MLRREEEEEHQRTVEEKKKKKREKEGEELLTCLSQVLSIVAKMKRKKTKGEVTLKKLLSLARDL